MELKSIHVSKMGPGSNVDTLGVTKPQNANTSQIYWNSFACIAKGLSNTLKRPWTKMAAIVDLNLQKLLHFDSTFFERSSQGIN